MSTKTLIVVTLCFASQAVLAGLAPYRRGVERYHGETTGRHIITLREGAPRTNVLALTKGTNSQIVTELDIINGFSGHFDEDTLTQLRSHPDVTLVAECSAGGCADIYVVDTGIYTTHAQFEGRARWGGTFGNYTSGDGSGHGTHCAGTAVGKQFGVAKAATVYAVKVLSDAGSGTTTDIINGLNWVMNNVRATGRPGVVSMSLGGGVSTALDNALTSLTSAGIHVAVAGGNSNADAGNTSPARVPSAITVGATTFADARLMTSSYGSVLDIWAPGQSIMSAWIGSPTATNILSGSSMAAPHVAGLIAYLICLEGNVTPAAMSTKIKNYALKDVISGIPSGTVNYLAHMPDLP
ncbi:peptidase S8/S53 domain-containing protein [Panaeolus papilionaceus]|nr:peptidase S8/S53 domain-containing protein [Panaeolus papilionaceus]